MEKLSIKNLIDFRRKSPRGQQTLIKNLKFQQKSDSEGGGDYWVRSISALGNTFRENDNQLIKDKIDHLSSDHSATAHRTTKLMYERNINILQNYEDFDFDEWKPSKDLRFLPKPKTRSILNINGLPIQVLPTHVFAFDDDKGPRLGGIWFVAKLDGLTREELGMYADALHRYLCEHYSEEYTIDPNYCLTVDVLNLKEAKYSQILKGEIPALLASTIDSIKSSL
ncbi:hypothetical protein MKJ04_14025 [Pontibacter sp. E15-1]|uniref:hypothetical protein n=1 Tax=Pontibacter sp. E15-1 TaxID=2919918 RepID=UPI001F4F7FE3|nr:hypothetical protein [Pontibacter sp. E15-1]MCJ8165962.1 hypothetical protein [Pontibacter sp. E15-1]